VLSPSVPGKFRMAELRRGGFASRMLIRRHHLASAAAEVEAAVRAVTSDRIDPVAPAGDHAE